MNDRKSEQMVYIKDLLFTVLYRWKTVLAVALVLGLVLGCLPLVLGEKPLTPEETQKVAIYEAEKTAMDQRIVSLQKSITERQTHLEESLLMKLDPYNHYEAQLTISVLVEGKEPGFGSAFDTQAVLEAYREVLVEESCISQLAQILQLPAQYTSELVSMEAVSIGADTLTVKVKCDSAEVAAQLADAVKTHLEGYSGEISKNVAPHSLSILKSTALAKADSALAESQKAEVTRLAELLTSLTDARNKRNALAKPDGVDAGSAVKSAVLLGAVGVFAGVFLCVFVLWVGHIGDGKVYSARTLENRTGVKILGCVDGGSKRGCVQRWLRRLEGRTVCTDAALPATDIRFRGEKVGKLLVTGSSGDETRKALAEALKKAMPGSVIVESKCVLWDVEALAALADCEGVVLVEQCGKSRYQEVNRQLERFADYGKHILGCVVVDG